MAVMPIALLHACGSDTLPPAKSAPAASGSAVVVDEGPPVHAPAGWRRFVAEDEGFTVYMPGTPVVAPAEDGKGPLLRATYKDRDTGCIYAVSYSELDPSFIGHPDELFAKLSADPGPGLTLLSDSPLAADGGVIAAGGGSRDYRFVDGAADTVLAMRVHAVDDHYYVVAVTFPKALFSEDAARTYLDTFRLTSSP